MTATAQSHSRKERSRFLVGALASISLILLLDAGIVVYAYWFRSSPVRRGLVADPASHDFGKVRQTDKLSHTFKVRNTFSQPVRITKLETSCTCTASSSDLIGRVVEAGEAIDLPVTMNAGGGRKASQASEKVKVAWENGQRNHTGILELRIFAYVQPEFLVEPQSLDFGTVSDYRPVCRTLRLQAIADPTLRVMEATTSHPQLVVNRIRPIDDGPYTDIDVSYQGKDQLQPSSITGLVKLKTSSTRVPELSFYVQGEFQPPVDVSPSSVTIAGIAGVVERMVTIRTASPSVISALSSNSSVIQADWRGKNSQPMVSAKEHTVAIRLADTSAEVFKGVVTARLVLTSSSKTDDVTIRIPVVRFPISRRS